MVKKSLPRSLSIVVEPSHRLITDSTDRVASGGVLIDGAQPVAQKVDSPHKTTFSLASPAPSSAFNIRSPPPRALEPPALSLGAPPPSASRSKFNLPRNNTSLA